MCRRSTYDEMILPRKSGRWRSRRSAYQFVWKYPEQAGLMQYSLRFHRKSENGWRQNHIMVESITTIAAPGAESGGGVPIAIFEMLQGLRRVGAESAWGANPGSTDCAGSPLRERSTFARDNGSLWGDDLRTEIYADSAKGRKPLWEICIQLALRRARGIVCENIRCRFQKSVSCPLLWGFFPFLDFVKTMHLICCHRRLRREMMFLLSQ